MAPLYLYGIVGLLSINERRYFMPQTNLSDIMNMTVGGLTLSKILSAVVTLLVCLLAVRLLMKVAKKLLSTTRLDARIQRYLLTGVKLVLYVITIVIVAESLNINTTSLVALLSVGSLGVTLAAEDILGNVAGGLVIISSHPFAIGDFVEANGVSGTVEEISLNHTKLVTPDGLLVMMPNKELASAKMTNYTVRGRRRVTQKVTASYDAPTETVKEACRKALAMTDNVLDDPAPAVRLTSYGESAIEYTVYCWAAADAYWDVYFALGEHLRTAFAACGVEMTYNHLNVHIVEGKG